MPPASRSSTSLAVLFGAALLACLAIPPRVWTGLPDLCLFHRIFQLPCPTCGLTRSWSALLHGDAGAAFRFHLLGPWLLAGLAGLLALGLLRGRAWLPGRAWGWAGACVWGSYAVARMIGWFPAPPLDGFRAPCIGVTMRIQRDDLSGPEVRALLEEHLREMHRNSPPESVHALDLAGLLRPEVTFWTVWSGAGLMGCGALKELDPGHGEVKSMRTAPAHRRQGVARAMLEHILEEAARRGYRRVSLETGSQAAYAPARRLYESHGFTLCPPFNGYAEDPHSVFMTRVLRTQDQVSSRQSPHPGGASC